MTDEKKIVVNVAVKDDKVYLFSDHDICTHEQMTDITDHEYVESGYAENREKYYVITPLRPNFAFMLRYSLSAFSVSAKSEDTTVLGEYADKTPKPKAKLSEDRKRLEIVIPLIEHYRKLMRSVDASPRPKGYFTVPVSRAVELYNASMVQKTKYPRMVFHQDARALFETPVQGFDGTIESLREVPLSALHMVQANTQSWKQRKANKKTLEEKFAEHGINSLYDLLFEIPRRYIDKSSPQGISDLVVGEEATVIGVITEMSTFNSDRGLNIDVELNVGGKVRVSFFVGSWMQKKFQIGSEVIVTGKYKPWRNMKQITGSTIEFADNAAALPVTPVYSQSEAKGITTTVVMRAVQELITRLGSISLPSYLKTISEERQGRTTYADLIRAVHFPENMREREDAIKQLAFYELVEMQVVVQSRNAEKSKDRKRGLIHKVHEDKAYATARKNLPFDLTGSQKRGIDQITAGMVEDKSYQALLASDVGTGKGLREDDTVFTPTGERKMKDLVVGSVVTGSDGRPTQVTGVFPQGEQDIIELRFTDGLSVKTDRTHLWSVKSLEDDSWHVISSEDILNGGVLDAEGRHRWSVPLLSGAVKYHADYEVSEEDRGFSVQEFASESLRKIDGDEQKDAEKAALILRSSEKVRRLYVETVQMLSGTSGGDISFASSEYAVCFASVVRSLGGYAVQDGIRVQYITEPAGDEKRIAGAALCDERERTICIRVDAPDSLFLTGDMTVTHNTVVSQLACLVAHDSGYQSVLIAPTEILARQLYQSFLALREGIEEPWRSAVNIVFYTGSMKAKEKREVLDQISSGEARIIVSTQAVMNGGVEFEDLGFVAIDEQQKFGAEQRSALLKSRADGRVPDLLMQTATPIPRSTAQVFYGDMDFIKLDEKPAGRLPIKTEWVQENPQSVVSDLFHGMWNDIKKELDDGRRAFVIAPLVEESSSIDASSVEATYQSLKKGAFYGYDVGYVHGKMKSEEARQVMQDFKEGVYQLIVASTVVEVGVDITEATRVVILSADRLGASSLHQIRGRVGRNSLQSKCYLVASETTDSGTERLSSLVEHEDGFEIAKSDLAVRGEGTLFSSSQSGKSEFIFLKLARHGRWVKYATSEAEKILERSDAQQVISHCREKFGYSSDDRML